MGASDPLTAASDMYRSSPALLGIYLYRNSSSMYVLLGAGEIVMVPRQRTLSGTIAVRSDSLISFLPPSESPVLP